jgi:hypothetical protein
MLRGVPALEVLDMDNSLPSANDHADLTGPIELPLSSLCLSSSTDYKEVTNILSIIVIPKTATLKLDVEYHRLVTTQEVELVLDGLASSLRTFFSPHTDLSYHNLHVYSREEILLRLRAWKDDDGTSVTPDLELILTLGHDLQVEDMRPIFISIPLSDMRTLTLDNTLDRLLLKDAFGRLSHLRNVKVVGDSIYEFLPAWIRRYKRYNTKRSSYYSVFFPALQFLWIEATSFKEGARTVEYFGDCLMERCERRAALSKLKLTECRGLRYGDVQSLRHIVVDVEWDGCEKIDDSDDSESHSDDSSF